MKLSGRLITTSSPQRVSCVIPVQEIASVTIGVSWMGCCYRKISPCIAQAADVVLVFRDINTATDYSAATEISFSVWAGGIGGTLLLEKTLTGGGVSIPNAYTFQTSLSNTDTAIQKGAHHCEAWVTSSAGERSLVGMGQLTVHDTRKFD